MKLDHIIRLLFVVIIIVGLLISAFTYKLYLNLCTSTTVYEGVEYIYSSGAYKLCGNNFGVVNIGDGPITITPIEEPGVYQYSPEQVVALEADAEATMLESGASYQMVASNNLIYKIDHPVGSSSEHSVEVRKF